MSREWKKCRLGDITDYVNRGFSPKYVENDGNVIINQKCIRNGRIDLSLSRRTDPLKPITLEKILKNGDILINSTGVGTAGRVGIFEFDLIATVDSHVTIVRMNQNEAFPNFVFYNLRHREEDIEGFAEGSTGQIELGRERVKLIDIFLPPLPEQKAIASVLSGLDDKIDLLHRQNKTLESMAETLFRKWFIEEADDSWEESTLGYFASNPKNSIKPSDLNVDTKYVGLEHIDRKNISLIQFGKAGEVISNKYQFLESDILFGKLRPYFHKVCFAPYEGVCSTDVLVIRPKKPHYFAYCLLAFYQEDVVEYANLGSGGTRMPRTDWKTLSQYPVAVPPENRLIEFNEIINPSVNKIKSNVTQIQTLEKIRDTLLPKIMSGEVRVKTSDVLERAVI